MGLFDEGHIGRIAGVEFYQSNNMVIRDGDKQVRKTLRERFTWKFWETHKTVPNMVPDRMLYKQDGRVIGHPETIREAMRHMEEYNESM